MLRAAAPSHHKWHDAPPPKAPVSGNPAVLQGRCRLGRTGLTGCFMHLSESPIREGDGDDSSRGPDLKFLHSQSALNSVKLELFRHLSTVELKSSLAPGQRGSLKIRPDGTIL